MDLKYLQTTKAIIPRSLISSVGVLPVILLRERRKEVYGFQEKCLNYTCVSEGRYIDLCIWRMDHKCRILDSA